MSGASSSLFASAAQNVGDASGGTRLLFVGMAVGCIVGGSVGHYLAKHGVKTRSDDPLVNPEEVARLLAPALYAFIGTLGGGGFGAALDWLIG